MKLYLLYYDEDSGGREDWSVFYCTPEIFLDAKTRAERKKIVKAKCKRLEFHEIDLETETTANFQVDYCGDEEDDEDE